MEKFWRIRIRDADDEILKDKFIYAAKENKSDASTEVRQYMSKYVKQFEKENGEIKIEPKPIKEEPKKEPSPPPFPKEFEDWLKYNEKLIRIKNPTVTKEEIYKFWLDNKNKE